MKNRDKRHIINSSNDKDAGLALILVILIIAIGTKNSLFLIPITVLIVVAMTVPILFKPFTKVWFGFSLFLGGLSSAIILTILFVVIVIPISYISRISDKDLLQLKMWKKDNESTFINRNRKYRAADIEQPF